jgi:hypothetical protein
MSYDYGSQSLGIRNPFRLEGALITLRGALLVLVGLYGLLTVGGLVSRGRELEGWISAGLGLLLLVWGLVALAQGLFKLFRFYVGRSVPASLARNQADSASKERLAYRSEELHDMLMGRKNTTFKEPQSLFSRLVHSVMPRLLFMPPVYRALTENLLFSLCVSLFMLLAFALAWFASATGLARLDNTPVMAWFGVLLTLYLLKLWMGMRDPFRHFSRGGMDISLLRICLVLALAILLPVLLAYVHRHVQAIPSLPVNTLPYLLTLLFLAALTCVLGLYMVLQRLQLASPQTEVSEHRNNWQKNLMPRELFIHLDSHILANRRVQEIPNRIYQNFDPSLQQEGGSEKGAFNGRTLVETQPVFSEIEHTTGFKWVRIITSVIGQLLLACGALWLATLSDDLAKLQHQPEVLMALIMPVLLLIFGSVLSKIGNAFWAEMQFRSLLLELSIEGTYTESRLSTGNSIYDSTRSENIVVRANITPWFLLSNLLTSTFAVSGNMNLEQERYILSLNKADDTLIEVLSELDGFFASRQAIAGINEVDLQSASQIFQMNEQTRFQPAASPAPLAVVTEHAAGRLAQEQSTDQPG